MLEALSDEALGELGSVLAEEPGFRANAASPDVYSHALHEWLLDACAREQGTRRGEAHPPLLAPALIGEELERARLFAVALACTFTQLTQHIPTTVAPAARERFERLADEIAPAMLTLAEGLGVLDRLAAPGTVH